MKKTHLLAGLILITALVASGCEYVDYQTIAASPQATEASDSKEVVATPTPSIPEGGEVIQPTQETPPTPEPTSDPVPEPETQPETPETEEPAGEEPPAGNQCPDPQHPENCPIVDPLPPKPPLADRGDIIVSGGIFETPVTPEPVLGDLDNIRIDVMVADFSDAGANRLGAVFCPTSNFDSTGCVRLRLEQSEKTFAPGQLVSYLLAPYTQDTDAGLATQANRIGNLRIQDLSYFRLYALGVDNSAGSRVTTSQSSDDGLDDTLFVSGVALSVQPKGANFFVPVYRNPCVNRWIERKETKDRLGNITATDYTSDHSLEGDEAICAYAKVADREDAGSDDRVTIEIPLSKRPEEATLDYLKNHQAGSDMPVRYYANEGRMTSELQYDRVGTGDYDDFRRGHATSYGFTVYQSNGSLKDTFNLRVHSGDWLKLERFDVYRIQPGSKDFLKGKKCASFFSTTMAPDGIPDLSDDSGEGVSIWSELDHAMMTANSDCAQFETIQPGPDTTAFGVK